MKQYRYQGALVLCALIWGCAFVAQSSAMEYVGPLTFTCIRSLLAALSLFIAMHVSGSNHFNSHDGYDNQDLVKGGVVTGLILALGASLQQIGIRYTAVGKAGFLSALYVILVPILSIVFGKKIRWNVLVAACMAMAGLYLLSFSGNMQISFGDTMIILCAIVYAFHILAIDKYSIDCDGMAFSFVQFLTAGLVTLIPAMLFEEWSWQMIVEAKWEILYAGVLSSCVAYTLQIIGQKHTDPSLASILLSLESVFAALAGYVLLQQTMSTKEIIGSVIIFAAILLAQLRNKGTE